ncbi:hypothetical protein LZK73_21895 [Neorhizobium galegae]|nr:hypothetical protein LZK73_21895 [Neorhizobium galegae]
MAYSYNEVGGKAPGSTIAVPFGFISRDHVTVTVDGVLQSAWSWLNDGTIQVHAGFTLGTTTRVSRRTPVGDLPSSLAGTSVLDWAGVNLNFRQTLYILQEYVDGEETRNAAVEEALAALQDGLEQVEQYAEQAGESAQQAQDTLTSLTQAVENALLIINQKVQDAEDAAEAAQTFDPENFYEKAETYPKTEVYSKAEVDALINNLNTLPVGTVIDVYGNGTTAIPGYLRVIPGLEITAAYPELRAFGLANGWAVNGSGNPVMPSGDSLFKRQWASGQARDAGRAFGSVQTDAMQQITGRVGSVIGGSYTGTGPFVNNNSFVGYQGGGGSMVNLDFDLSLAARTAAETRPANITVTWYIRAYSVPVDASQVASAQALNDIANARARLVLVENASFKKLYRSSALTYANSAMTTAAHGLGAVPTFISAQLVCLSTDQGYPAGHRVELHSFYGWNGSVNLAATLWADASTIGLSVANGIVLSQYLSATAATLSPTRWALFLEARL